MRSALGEGAPAFLNPPAPASLSVAIGKNPLAAGSRSRTSSVFAAQTSATRPS